MGRRRGLSPEDKALWQRVASGLRPLHPGPASAEAPAQRASPADAPPLLPRPPSAPLATPPLAAPRRPAPGTARPSTAVTVTPAAAISEPLRMDHRLHGRMVRGKLRPEARLDLHGMTLVEAHAALSAFILAASRRGLRLVLVITGKGRGGGRPDDSPLPRRTGALRHEVPHWLRSAPLRGHVLNTHTAHRSHGGDGALYVYLRKPG